VVDVTDVTSLDQLEWIVEQFMLYAKENSKKVLLINKQDLREERVLSNEQIEREASRLGFDLVFKTSCSTGEGVDEAFNQLGKLLAISQEDLDDQVYEDTSTEPQTIRERGV
jgi:GTPase Era involved in 16S rRNA processing